MPSQSFHYADPAGCVEGWSGSSNETDGSHSGNISSANTPISSWGNQEQKKRKRREGSTCSDSMNETYQGTKAMKRSPTEAGKKRTQAIREDRACLPCQLEKRGCNPIDTLDPESPCDRCIKRLNALGRIVLCCRVNITDLLIFRSGPTATYAHTLRYLILGSSPDQAKSKRIKKLIGPDRRSGAAGIKVLRLSQGHGGNTLNLKAQKYTPKDTDKVDYTWGSGINVGRFECPHYALADLEHVQITLERFLDSNITGYVMNVLSGASDITRKVFDTALAHLVDSKLVELALQFWVASRFIETPWCIMGPETLGMGPDQRPESPYYGVVPVTPIMDQQLDNIVIYHLLEPLWKKIRRILRTKLLENKKQDWFELQLALFILLSHVELTMAHDIDFSNRHGLSTTFSNPPLIERVTHAADTLLKYFHNPGINMYYPFHAPWRRVEEDYGWKDVELADSHEAQKILIQKHYVIAIRKMLAGQREKPVGQTPGKEMFWTSQLYRNDWTPTDVKAYA